MSAVGCRGVSGPLCISEADDTAAFLGEDSGGLGGLEQLFGVEDALCPLVVGDQAVVVRELAVEELGDKFCLADSEHYLAGVWGNHHLDGGFVVRYETEELLEGGCWDDGVYFGLGWVVEVCLVDGEPEAVRGPP